MRPIDTLCEYMSELEDAWSREIEPPIVDDTISVQDRMNNVPTVAIKGDEV
ncbi:MAG TPA: hypothetical protein VD789_01500 [Thermomicrobiales bacterium]|nr:hypothetical protein [Thermomicrobiales bacterium]